MRGRFSIKYSVFCMCSLMSLSIALPLKGSAAGTFHASLWFHGFSFDLYGNFQYKYY